jgi:predicted DsbA family dithiol-disulfide isomerase
MLALFFFTNFMEMDTVRKTMSIEIWSDVMCPFCYIGKRKFEKALEQFADKSSIDVIWKSFQLAPGMKTDPTKNIHQYLAEHKGISLDEAQQLNDRVTQMAAHEGLNYRFDKAIVANSFNAHRFAHFAKQYNKQNEAEEILFRAYFSEGKNTDDYATLCELGNEIGLDATALRTALETGMYADDVRSDIYEAQQLGVTGVPFFVFNRRYAVSGAQESQVFLQTLVKSVQEWQGGITLE